MLPLGWPQRRFDLILLSELGYYLDLPALMALQAQVSASLAPGGTLMLCHWCGVFDDRVLPTRTVHAVFHETTELHSVLRYDDGEILIEVCSSRVITGESSC